MDKEINCILGQRIRQIRKKKGLTREQLSEKLSVSTRFLANVESGKTGVSISTLKSISIVLDTQSDYLLGIYDDTDDNYYKQSTYKKIMSLDPKYLSSIDQILESIKQITKI